MEKGEGRRVFVLTSYRAAVTLTVRDQLCFALLPAGSLHWGQTS